MEYMRNEYIWSLIRVIFYLGAVILLILLLRTFVMKKLRFDAYAQAEDGGFRIRQRFPLGMRKQILMVEYRNEILLLGITESNINLLKSFPLLNDTERNHQFTSELRQMKQSSNVEQMKSEGEATHG